MPARPFLIALTLCAIPLTAPAGDFDPSAVDAIVEKAAAAFHAPGVAVVVVKDDGVVHLKGYGVRAKDDPEPVTPDTVFAIASCSKAFTATAAAMLVDDGKLGWDDPVRKHLDYFRLPDPLADREVTVRDLLCHRTGMPRHDALWSDLSEDAEDVIRRYGRAKPSTSFRSKWEYANVPFTAAGLIVGKRGGSDWAGVVRKRIFGPLGMTSAGCTVGEALAARDHATPHHLTLDGKVIRVEWDRIDHAGGAGCVSASARDMGRWLRFQLAGGKAGGKQLVSAKSLRETHSPQMVVRPDRYFSIFYPEKAGKFVNYGLGWFVHDYRGHHAVSHGGTLSGFRAQLMMVPDKKVGVFVVSNLRPSYLPEAVARAVLDHLLGLPDEDWVKFYTDALTRVDGEVFAGKIKRLMTRKPGTHPSREPAAYAGTYEEPAYGSATVTADGDRLVLTWGKLTFRLDHYHFDTFTATLTAPAEEVVQSGRSTQDAQFRLGADGEVESLRFLDQEFRRK